MSFQILIDSCGDLTEKMRNHPHIQSIPLRIRVGKKEYVDDASLNRQELLADIAHSHSMPSSSCPSPAQYADACDIEADRIYIITGSSALTGSYNSACLAKKMREEDQKGKTKKQQILVIDSRSASAGELLLARQILQWEEQKVPAEEIRKRIREFVSAMMTRFVLEDLTILERSGRLTGLKARLAGALHICPVLGSTKEGTICQTGQARGIKRAVSAMIHRIAADRKEREIHCVVISHCCQEEMAVEVKTKLKKILPPIPILLVATGGISSMYAGKGGIIVAYA